MQAEKGKESGLCQESAVTPGYLPRRHKATFPRSTALVLCCPVNTVYFCTQGNISIFHRNGKFAEVAAGRRLSLFRNYPFYTQRAPARPPFWCGHLSLTQRQPSWSQRKWLHTVPAWLRMEAAGCPCRWSAGRHSSPGSSFTLLVASWKALDHFPGGVRLFSLLPLKRIKGNMYIYP